MRRYRGTRRINIELGPKNYKALERLQVALEASSQVETIRLALQTLLRLVEATQQGARVIIERQEGRLEVILPIIPESPVEGA